MPDNHAVLINMNVLLCHAVLVYFAGTPTTLHTLCNPIPFAEDCEAFVRLGTPQDQALSFAMDMLITVLNSCTEVIICIHVYILDFRRATGFSVSTVIK